MELHMLYFILVICFLNLLLTIAIAGAVAKLISNAQSREEMEDFTKLMQRQPSYADIESHYDGFQLRARNFDGLKIIDKS